MPTPGKVGGGAGRARGPNRTRLKPAESRSRRKLRGYRDLYRIRIGTFRVIYSVETERLLVLVLKIGHRRRAYR